MRVGRKARTYLTRLQGGTIALRRGAGQFWISTSGALGAGVIPTDLMRTNFVALAATPRRVPLLACPAVMYLLPHPCTPNTQQCVYGFGCRSCSALLLLSVRQFAITLMTLDSRVVSLGTRKG